MKCKNCGMPFTGKPLQMGPTKLGLIYCSWKCYVFDAIKSHPGTSLSNSLKRIYPEIAVEVENMKRIDSIRDAKDERRQA